jgi:anaerobic ribonucleoside-triphosphate reductase activating protein
MRIHSISYPDINNGLGCRVTIWVAGCSHHCKGCQNRETWPFKSGRPFSSDDKEKLFDILSRDYIKGITFSGGDPLDSLDDTVSFILSDVKPTGL